MIVTLLLSFLAAEAEAPTLGLSLQPPSIELPSPEPAVQCEPGMTLFDPDPVPLVVDKVIEYTDDENMKRKWVLRQGILLSECGFVEVLNTQAEHGRMRVELNALRVLTKMKEDFWVKAEYQYQERVMKLEEERAAALEPSLWDEWKSFIMFGAGIVVAGFATWGVVELMKAQASWNSSL